MGVVTNVFLTRESDVQNICQSNQEMYDGYLGFTANGIIKFKKTNTVDLLFERAKKKNQILENQIRFASGETLFQEGFSIKNYQPRNDVEFEIIECTFYKGTFHFLKIRNDKIVANSLKMFKTMYIIN